MEKAILFDLFGTIFDMSEVPKAELAEYGRQIADPDRYQFELPPSWANLEPFPDVFDGLDLLAERYVIGTFSNAPIPLQVKLARRYELGWYCMVPLEAYSTKKPRPEAYRIPPQFLRLEPSEIMVVTANEHFGDLAGAAAVGMVAQLIRGDSDVADVRALAKKLGC